MVRHRITVENDGCLPEPFDAFIVIVDILVHLADQDINVRQIPAIFIAFVFIVLGNIAFAADNVPKYQVVNGSDDKAYLVNTSTGFVWVLTYRSIATGREPIAIPYKFIKICPKDQKDFIVEDVQGVCMPGK